MILCCFQKSKSTDDIGLYKCRRAFNTAIYMGLSSKVNNSINLFFCKYFIEQFAIADITTHEPVALIVIEIGQVSQIACIGQIVEVGNATIIE